MEICSNISGSVCRVQVKPGDKVSVGNELIIMESMKMEIPITAEENGLIIEVKVAVGDFVQEGDVVAVME